MKKEKKEEEVKVVKKFEYSLRECNFNFSLTTLLQMKDFRVLLLKGLEDLDKVIAEYETKS